VILGADAVLAARPATPGQLANACYAAGYGAVIPSSWGDELVAAGALREIAARGQGSVVLCSCPRVVERMRRVASLLPQLLPMASPPVAAARYLRARAGRHGVHITYVGECPGAADPSIDRHATPASLLRSLAKRGINPLEQPTEVEERLLRDARRFYSLPGGAPAPNWLYVEKRGYTLVEPAARDFLAEVAYRVSNKERRVVDLAPRLGCACSGVVAGHPWGEAREAVAATEPPRAVHEVLDHDVTIDLSAPLEPWTGSNGAGAPTIPITLDALAGMYDPEQKAEPVRAPPPTPLRGRVSSHNGESPTGSFITEPSTAGPPDTESEPQQSPADSSPNGEPRTRPAPEPRTGEVHITPLRAARASGPRTAPLKFGSDRLWDQTQFQFGRYGLVRRVITAVGIVMVAAVGIVLAQRALATYVPKVTGPEAAPAKAPVAPASPVAAANDSLDTSVVPPLPPDPVLPRLPIGPTGPVAAPLVATRVEDALKAWGPFHANPAPAYTPGAAPIPKPVGRSASDAYGQSVFPLISPAKPADGANLTTPDDLPPLALRPAGSPPTPSEALAIRLEILRRRRRADSLRRVVDSLGARINH
jgi:hypothetical protein